MAPKDWIPSESMKKRAEFAKNTLVKNWKGGHTSPAPLQHVTQTGIDFSIPDALLNGTTMIKVSGIARKKKVYQLDPDGGCILYSKSSKIGIGTYFASRLSILGLNFPYLVLVPIETIKEIRTGTDAKYDRVHFKLPEDAEARWITVIYILEGKYKTLHLIAETPDIMAMWDTALRKLVAVRLGLMSGLGNAAVRQAVWDRQYWKGADRKGDQRLEFGEMEMLCKRLNASLDAKELRELFNVSKHLRSG
jgi:phosphatidylinositol phospholipase C, delta